MPLQYLGKTDPLNLQLLQARVVYLFSNVTLYGGKDLVSFSMPGQHLTFSRVGNTVQEEFSAVQLALAIIAGKPTVINHVYLLFF